MRRVLTNLSSPPVSLSLLSSSDLSLSKLTRDWPRDLGFFWMWVFIFLVFIKSFLTLNYGFSVHSPIYWPLPPSSSRRACPLVCHPPLNELDRLPTQQRHHPLSPPRVHIAFPQTSEGSLPGCHRMVRPEQDHPTVHASEKRILERHRSHCIQCFWEAHLRAASLPLPDGYSRAHLGATSVLQPSPALANGSQTRPPPVPSEQSANAVAQVVWETAHPTSPAESQHGNPMAGPERSDYRQVASN